MSTNGSWEEQKRKLEEGIDAFARGEVKIAQEPPPKTNTTPPAPAPTPVAAKPIVAPPPPPSAPKPALGATDTGGSGGLLARLKQQAAEKLAEQEQGANQHAERISAVSNALRDTYIYLRDLCEQLNVIKPSWPKTYFINETLAFADLAWSEGRADFRKQPGATDDRPYERVSLRLSLDGPAELVIDRENPAMEKLRQLFVDNNITHHLDEVRNNRGYTERGRFKVKPLLRAGLLFVGDYEASNIRLKVVNLPRLGSFEFLIPSDGLDHAVLEEIALLVVGESTQFFKHFKRIA
jgi:hypothetical protein